MTMTTNEKGTRVLTPSDGKYLTNGETYSQRVYLGKDDSQENWTEVDSIPNPEEELTAEEALAELMEVLA